MQVIYSLNGRVCYSFPWESSKEPCPWNADKYERVVIPFNAIEARGSNKKVHIQIVRRDKLVKVKDKKVPLH